MKYVAFVLASLITTNAFAEDCNVQVVETYYDSSSQVSSKKTKDYSFNEIKRNSASILVHSEGNSNYECKSFVDDVNVIVNCTKDNSTSVGKAIVANGNSGSVNIDNVFSLDITNCKKEVKETSPVVAQVTKQEVVLVPKTYPIPMTTKEPYLNNSWLFAQFGIGAGNLNYSDKFNSAEASGMVASLMLGPKIPFGTRRAFMVIGIDGSVMQASYLDGKGYFYSKTAKNTSTTLSLTNFALHFQFRNFYFKPAIGAAYMNFTSGDGSTAITDNGDIVTLKNV